jgi:alpha-glucosidase (family GH31 glycosyl hydrolase)
MDARQGEDDEYNHFDVHNIYGYTTSEPTLEASKQNTLTKRGYVVSRSTFIGSGKYTGHWTGVCVFFCYFKFLIYSFN